MTAGLNLLISDKADVERDAVAGAFESCGGTVHRIGRFWEPPTFEVSTVRVYGAVVFCLVLQQKLGLTLCSPPDELLLGAFSIPESARYPSNAWRDFICRPSSLHQTCCSQAI